MSACAAMDEDRHVGGNLGSLSPPWGSDDLAPHTLRKLLGSYPTGVAIVTTSASDGRPVGLTINSFASLSLDPPLVLWSLVNHSPSLAVFRDCAHFAIHVLPREHEELARRFANPAVVDKFAELDLHHARGRARAARRRDYPGVCQRSQPARGRPPADGGARGAHLQHTRRAPGVPRRQVHQPACGASRTRQAFLSETTTCTTTTHLLPFFPRSP